MYVPVMTENVMISCDADSALWNYFPIAVPVLTNESNPVTIDLFTLQYATGYSCTDENINNNRKIVKYISLMAYGELCSDWNASVFYVIILFTGSGIYKQQQQQQDTYTQLTEGESVYITEDTTLVCVSSTAVSYSGITIMWVLE